MTDPIEERVISLIANRVGINAATITPAATLKALGVAFCRANEITFEIEDVFDINVPVGACDLGTDTLGTMIEAVRAALVLSAVTHHATARLYERRLSRLPALASPCAPAQDEYCRWLYAENAQHVYP